MLSILTIKVRNVKIEVCRKSYVLGLTFHTEWGMGFISLHFCTNHVILYEECKTLWGITCFMYTSPVAIQCLISDFNQICLWISPNTYFLLGSLLVLSTQYGTEQARARLWPLCIAVQALCFIIHYVSTVVRLTRY